MSHEHEFLAVGTLGSRGESEPILGGKHSRHLAERFGTHVVDFIGDDEAEVILDPLRVLVAAERMQHRHGDGFVLARHLVLLYVADLILWHPQELGDLVFPLLHHAIFGDDD